MVVLLIFCCFLFISYHVTCTECLTGICIHILRVRKPHYVYEMKLERCNSSTSRYLEHSHCSHFSALPFCICLLLLFLILFIPLPPSSCVTIWGVTNPLCSYFLS